MALEWGYNGNTHGYELAYATTNLATLFASKGANQHVYSARAEGLIIGRHESTGHATLEDAKAAAVALAVQALDALYAAERAALGVEV